ncbi:hypothetical protein [Nostoc sp.]|uniref:hypothetical protein n=1 Tax=Nostoc sp. TaxID=1180 RepID=UPI002FF5083D
MKRNPTLPPNFMLGYAIAAPNLQNYGSQGRQGLILKHNATNRPFCRDAIHRVFTS